jgi:competence protein ComEA
MPNGRDINLKPAWWVAYGVLCGLAAAGLILLIATPRRGQPIVLLPAPTPGQPSSEVALAQSVEPTSAFPLNINTASAADLDQLPGIGPSLAQSIIALRDANGPFESLEELLEVPGIGQRTFDAILPFIALEGP